MFEFVSMNNSFIFPTSVHTTIHQCQTAKINIKIDISNFFDHNFLLCNKLKPFKPIFLSIYNLFGSFR